MNRKSFLGLLGGFLGALAVGLKLSKARAPIPYPGAELESEWTKVAGVSIYCDKYCPEHMMYFVHKDHPVGFYDQVAIEAQSVLNMQPRTPREVAFLSIIGYVKNLGYLPQYAITGPKRWAKIDRENRQPTEPIYFWGNSLDSHV